MSNYLIILTVLMCQEMNICLSFKENSLQGMIIPRLQVQEPVVLLHMMDRLPESWLHLLWMGKEGSSWMWKSIFSNRNRIRWLRLKRTIMSRIIISRNQINQVHRNNLKKWFCSLRLLLKFHHSITRFCKESHCKRALVEIIKGRWFWKRA